MNHETEMLLLPDGRLLVHNLTPKMAALLSNIMPTDIPMQRRAALSKRCLGNLSLSLRARPLKPT
jgi:hypothetical protein